MLKHCHHRTFHAILAAWVLALTNVADLHRAAADEPQPDKTHFQETVAPILETRCLSCHRGVTARGGLSLETAEGILRGGDSGPAIEPGNSADSLLIEMICGDDPLMPDEGDPLSADEVAAVRAWIDSGAAWPAGQKLRPRGASTWWSLTKLKRPPVPQLDSEWIRTPIDAFILQKLREEGLEPAAEADRRTLIRRLTYDMHGLPPTPAEIDDFVNDSEPGAYRRLIERLLDSPRYGERWARHWLDVVHYGETHGYDKDKRRDHAWPYRDYVIRSLNEDKPYARFIREQLAGDVLAPDDPESIIATGFIAAGPWDFVGHVELREGTMEKKKTRSLDRDDMLANAISTFSSMTVHCARCHDHPFDPIPQEDYYRLQAVFAGVDRGEREYAESAQLENSAKDRVANDGDSVGTQADTEEPDGSSTDQKPRPNKVYAILSHEPRPIHVLVRGEVTRAGEPVGPGALSCLEDMPAVFELGDAENEGGRRLALARWLADADNPLTWRSIVNRVWHYHVGRGLVDTPSDFGRNGSLPTHPELLEWLAAEFRDSGGSLKRLHRLILQSAVYRQQSRGDETFAAIDAGNRYLWRMNRRRIEAEALRDAVLYVSGNLDLTMRGPSFEAFDFEDDHSPRYRYVGMNDRRTWRRTIYRYVVRSVPDPFLEALDCPDASLKTPVRQQTLTALHALALLNDSFMIEQAQHFAARLEADCDQPSEQIEQAVLLAWGRPPDDEERRLLVDYAREHGLAAACRVIFNSNEFMFVD